MSHVIKFSLALATAFGVSGATAFMAIAQDFVEDITLSEDVLDICDDYGLNEPACACFFAALIEDGELDEDGYIDAAEWLEAYPDYADACAEVN
ncbi:hypothetical protein GFS31_03880 [Leptolyngbya sp. BL0902]|uniref:hypothetical protein n=1 Tax=Leptolyngbya sp. BL0902 TaxID=1115757 RepID=UPI0018E8596C|nr:hypothetical protein [Leptolyngbya sp. BL0902]QQE63719.1 hypothetical protein GFS31_03880 [Leptolyngbya sp. BL0902]